MKGYVQWVHHSVYTIINRSIVCYHCFLFMKTNPKAFILNWDPKQYFFFQLQISDLIGGVKPLSSYMTMKIN